MRCYRRHLAVLPSVQHVPHKRPIYLEQDMRRLSDGWTIDIQNPGSRVAARGTVQLVLGRMWSSWLADTSLLSFLRGDWVPQHTESMVC